MSPLLARYRRLLPVKRCLLLVMIAAAASSDLLLLVSAGAKPAAAAATVGPNKSVGEQTTSAKQQQHNLETTTADTTTTTTTTSTTTTTTTASPDTTSTPDPRVPCNDAQAPPNYCLNGGFCHIIDNKPQCECREGFYGQHCEKIDLCLTPQVGELTGQQICQQINATCNREKELFLRCNCPEGEYFVLNLLPIPGGAIAADSAATGADEHATGVKKPKSSGSARRRNTTATPTSSEDKTSGSKATTTTSTKVTNETANYVAECRKIDRCVGVKCARVSEVCKEGRCICDKAAGYMLDPADNRCKLINPCNLQQQNEASEPLCGEARCLPTYNNDLYRCVCPLGYNSVETVDGQQSSIKCRIIEEKKVCGNPLLNKCEHKCSVDNGVNIKCTCYEGYRAGLRADIDDHICYFDMDLEHLRNEIRAAKSRPNKQPDDGLVSFNPKKLPSWACKETCPNDNMICIKSPYREAFNCVCDRQAYISVDGLSHDSNRTCVDWCEASQQDPNLLRSLDDVCLSGRCQLAEDWPAENDSWKHESNPIRTFNASDNIYDIAMQFRTWRRPRFECDCSSSSYLYQDPTSGLCKLNFSAVLAPCREGAKGHEDCVQNKTAYCSVLHLNQANFFNELKDRSRVTGANRVASSRRPVKTTKPNKPDRSYTCVCSPEKILLVDKPRGKAMCVRECDMVNNECVRYNRMCRPALMRPDNYLTTVSLVSTRSDGAQFNIQDTRCECLPGFTGPQPDTDDDSCKDDTTNGGSSSDADSYIQSNKHMRINTSCLLDYDVIELFAEFNAPADFDPTWLLNDSPGGYTRKQIEDFWAAQAGGGGDGLQLNTVAGKANGGWQASSPATRSAQDTTQCNKTAETTTMNASQEPALPALEAPDFMWYDSVDELYRQMILVGSCDYKPQLNTEFYLDCVKHRYWIVRKLRKHFIDWRSVLAKHLKETFDLMDGNVKVHVNHCRSIIREAISKKWSKSVRFGNESWLEIRDGKTPVTLDVGKFGVTQLDRPVLDPTDETELLNADLICNLTLHSSPSPVVNINPKGEPPILVPYPAQEVRVEKQLVKFIFDEKTPNTFRDHYQLMVPKMLIKRETMNNLMNNRKSFDPCNSNFEYCDKQTVCYRISATSPNFTCTCKHGFTPIGSKDIYDSDSRKEVCEDINECLFDMCKEKANISRCVNEIGDFRCECMTPYVKDNNGNCKDACDVIPCHQEHGICRKHGDYPVCECKEGYTKLDCSVPDPNVALRKANMIIIGSIFSSVLLLAITVAISQSKQLKKKKLELAQIKAEQESFRMYEFARQRPMKHRSSKRTAM